MTVVWLLAALLVVATVWFLARAVRSAPARPVSADYDGKMQLRDRLLAQLRELDIEEADRNVDATIASDERQRLEAELAQVLRDLESLTGEPANQAASESPRPLWFATVFVLALTVPLVSASLYLLKNGSTLGQLSQAGSTSVTAEAGQAPGAAPKNLPPMVLKMVGRLEARLKEQPNDPQGWARLARSYQVLGRQDDARQAYARAYELAPDDTQVVSAYAGFLMSSSPTHMSAQTIAVFRKLHALEPKHPGALWALGFAAYQEKDFAQAVKYWEQLLVLLPPNHEAVAQLRHALSIARTEAAKAKK